MRPKAQADLARAPRNVSYAPSRSLLEHFGGRSAPSWSVSLAHCLAEDGAAWELEAARGAAVIAIRIAKDSCKPLSLPLPFSQNLPSGSVDTTVDYPDATKAKLRVMYRQSTGAFFSPRNANMAVNTVAAIPIITCVLELRSRRQAAAIPSVAKPSRSKNGLFFMTTAIPAQRISALLPTHERSEN